MFPADTVMYRDSFKHHSEHVEGPQLDQEEMTTVAVLGLQPGTEAWRGCHSTHTGPAACQSADGKEWGSAWGGEGKESISQKVCSHFPETQCHQQKSLKAEFSFGCALETRPWPAVWWEISNSQSGVWHLGNPGHSLGELCSLLCPGGIKVWTALLVLWSSRSNEQVPTVLLLAKQMPPSFEIPKYYKWKRGNRNLTSLVLM